MKSRKKMRLGSGKSSGKLQAAERNIENKNEKDCVGEHSILYNRLKKQKWCCCS